MMRVRLLCRDNIELICGDYVNVHAGLTVRARSGGMSHPGGAKQVEGTRGMKRAAAQSPHSSQPNLQQSGSGSTGATLSNYIVQRMTR